MPDWMGWLAFAALLGIAELVTLAFAAGLMSVAAVVSAVVAAAGGGFEAQSVAFAATSIAALAAVYPLARRGRGHGSYRRGTDTLNDQHATVIRQVDALDRAVRIGGDVWSARAYDQTQVIAEGTRVAVIGIRARPRSSTPWSNDMPAFLIILFTVLVVLAALSRTIRVVPQTRAYIVERFGSYDRTLSAGFNTLLPGVERDGFASAFGSPTPKTAAALAEPNGAAPARRTSHSNRRPVTD